MITALATSQNLSNLSEYTFSSISFGSEAADRYIVVLIAGTGNGSSRTLDSATIGGEDATILGQVSGTGFANYEFSGALLLLLPTGSSGDVVLSFSGTMDVCFISVLSVTGLGSLSLFDSASASGTSDPDVSIDIPASSPAFGAAFRLISTTASWGGLTERTDGSVSAFFRQSTAYDEFESSESGYSVSVNWSNNGENCLFAFSLESTPLTVVAISGEVTLNGNPVEGATVRIIRESDNVALTYATTDSSGAYEFTDLDSEETYHVAVEYEADSVKYNAKSDWSIVPVEVES